MNKPLIHILKILKDKKTKLAVSTWGRVHRWFVQSFFPNKKDLVTRLKAFSSNPVLSMVEPFPVDVIHPSLAPFANWKMQVLLLSSAPTAVVM